MDNLPRPISARDAPDAPRLPSPDATSEPNGRTSAGQVILAILGIIAFLYYARPFVLPVFLATLGGMTLKPLVRWFSRGRIPTALSAAVVLGILVSGISLGFFQLGHPALVWMNEAPQHMTELRQRFQKVFPRFQRFSQAATAMNNLGATEAERQEAQAKVPTVGIQENRGTASILNWTGTFVVGIGETLVLLYLILASGDLFLQKLVRVLPSLHDKKRAVEISHEIQQNISNYLFSVSLINAALGLMVSAGLYTLGVPNPFLWGTLAALLNFIPTFGPIAGVLLLAIVGLLTFDSLLRGLLPPVFYLLLHLVEANLITPVLLGRRFTLNPVIIFISLIFWTWLWGVPGALLSVPILVSVKAICDRIPNLSAVSELLTR